MLKHPSRPNPRLKDVGLRAARAFCHETSYQATYGHFYKYLPQDKIINLKDILTAQNQVK